MAAPAAPPVIGISCYLEPVNRGDWVAQPSAVLPATYVRQVNSAGGVAVLLPPRLDATLAVAHAVLARLDALIICGGADIDPARYGAQPHPSVQSGSPDRDAWELALITAAIERDLPLLGICRGMQLMAVQAGWRLEQHVPDRVGHQEHSPHLGAYGRHSVRTVPGTRIAQIIGQNAVVPTYHHQAVVPESLVSNRRTSDHPGEGGYWPAAWHEDGTLEAMEAPTGCFRLGVQWHPEAGEDPAVFTALIAAAAGG